MEVRALLVEDDVRFADLLRGYLTQNGIHVTHAPDGGRALAVFDAGAFDVVLLDLMLPGMDGLEVCKRLRERGSVPILMLTARGDEADRVVGLEIGADDYLAKPFSPRELLARIRAVLRRTMPDPSRERLVVGPMVIDVGARSVAVDGKLVTLTGIEFDLLIALARRAGRVVPRDGLMELAGRGDVNVGERTVDVHVSHLRSKLGDDPKNPRWIKTVRGVGYMLVKDREGE